MPGSLQVGRTGTIGNDGVALDKLREFTDGLEKGDRLRGRKDDQGNITLYVRKNAPSALSKISPKAIYHRHLAQKAIRRVLKNAERADGPDLSAAKNANAGAKRTGLDRLFRSGEITGQNAKDAVRGAVGIRDFGKIQEPYVELTNTTKAALQNNRYIPRHNSDPGISDPGALRSYIVNRTKDDMDMNLDIEFINDSLGAEIAEQYLGAGGDRHAFVSSQGERLKRELTEMLRDVLGKGHELVTNDDDLHEFTSRAVDVAAMKMSEGQLSGDVLYIGGKEFKRDPVDLGKGGQGTVALYIPADGEGESIAVKFPKEEGDAEAARERFVAMGHEIETHRQIDATGEAKVVGFKGAVRTPEGRLGMAMSVVGAGTADNAVDAIGTALQEGTISPVTAQALRLTMIQDMVESIAHINTRGGAAHLDIKGDNFFISQQGVTHGADFGLSSAIDDFDLYRNQVTASPMHVPPEVSSQTQALRDFEKYFDAAKVSAEVREKIISQFPSLSDDDVNTLTTVFVMKERIHRHSEMATRQPDVIKWDAFALGSSSFYILYERHIVRGKELGEREVKNYVAERQVIDFGRDPGAMPIADQDDAGDMIGTSFGGRSGVEGADDFLTRLLDRDSDQRATAAEMRGHAVFNNPGVGRPETRSLLVELLQKNQDQESIRRLNQQIRIMARSQGQPDIGISNEA